MQGQYLEHLTWNEAEEVIKESPVILIPLGARLKEHGHHLPLNNDWVTAQYLTKRVLELFPALAIPTVQYNYFPAFVDYPGSIHISQETSQALLDDLISSLARHGAKKFYVLNNGVSTNWVLEPLRLELQKRNIIMEYLDLLGDELAEIENKISEQSHGTHADEMETSMMMYLAPEIVKFDKAVDETAKKEKGPFRRNKEEKGLYSPTGAWGQPTLATLEKGKAMTEEKVELLLKILNNFCSDAYVPAPKRPQYL